MNLIFFASPWVLWLLPLAFLPLVLDRANDQPYTWVAMLPKDRLSDLLGWLLKGLAVIALIFTILGLASPHSHQQHIQRVGVGAQIALVLDRSASMDDPFSGETSNNKAGETKSAAASRLIRMATQGIGSDCAYFYDTRLSQPTQPPTAYTARRGRRSNSLGIGPQRQYG